MPDLLTAAEREIEERCARATKGPWFAVKIVHDFIVATADSYDAPIVTSTGEMGMPTKAAACNNAKFLACARTDIPNLLQALRAEREQRVKLEERVRELENAK